MFRGAFDVGAGVFNGANQPADVWAATRMARANLVVVLCGRGG
jgi:hypothetical protein